MKKNVDISVSTDPILDLQNIIEYAKQMQGVADFLHCDVMNQNFVPKNTYDYAFVNNINRMSQQMIFQNMLRQGQTLSQCIMKHLKTKKIWSM